MPFFALGHTSLACLLSLGVCGLRVFWQIWGYFRCLVYTGWTLSLHLIDLDSFPPSAIASPSLLFFFLRDRQNITAFKIQDPENG